MTQIVSTIFYVKRNITNKSKENLGKLRFPAFSAGKIIFSKIGLRLGIAQTNLFAKNQRKLMMKSREYAKKPVFPAYFRHFRPGKICFSKIGLCHILGLAILHQCAKFHEKNMKYSSRNSRNTVFPAKIGYSGDF